MEVYSYYGSVIGLLVIGGLLVVTEWLEGVRVWVDIPVPMAAQVGRVNFSLPSLVAAALPVTFARG